MTDYGSKKRIVVFIIFTDNQNPCVMTMSTIISVNWIYFYIRLDDSELL